MEGFRIMGGRKLFQALQCSNSSHDFESHCDAPLLFFATYLEEPSKKRSQEVEKVQKGGGTNIKYRIDSGQREYLSTIQCQFAVLA